MLWGFLCKNQLAHNVSIFDSFLWAGKQIAYSASWRPKNWGFSHENIKNYFFFNSSCIIYKTKVKSPFHIFISPWLCQSWHECHFFNIQIEFFMSFGVKHNVKAMSSDKHLFLHLSLHEITKFSLLAIKSFIHLLF